MSWKPPTSLWLKVNMDGSVVGSHAAYGGIFRDHLDTFLEAFSCNIGSASVFDSEVLCYILALEYAAHNGWSNVWLESDLTSVLIIFKNDALVPISLRNRWHNVIHFGVQIIFLHIFREDN